MSATIISIPQLAIAIEPNVTNSPTQDEFRVSATIRPLTQFSHKFVTAKKFHVIIDLDTSGSMSSIMNSLSDTDVSQNTLQTLTIPDWLNIGQFNNIMTRLDCSIKAIKKLLEFFRVLSENGIEVFFTLNGFNHRVNRVFEYARIPSVTTTDNRPASIYTLASRMVDYQGDPFESPMSVETVTNTPITNPTSIKQMFSECGGIGTHGSTNIHNVIVHTNELKQKYGNSQDMQTISILLSDGYVTSGFSRHQLCELVQTNPDMKYDVTIGIGEESDYDAELLKSITREDDVRGCPCIDDLYDNLISCIFHKMNIFARNVNLVHDGQSGSRFEYTTSPDQSDCSCFNVPEFRFEQFIGFAGLSTHDSSINIRMEQIPMEITNADEPDNIIDCIYGGPNNEWKICYTRNRCSSDNTELSTETIRRYDADICIELLSDCITTVTMSNQEIQHHIVSEYMKITRELDNIDMEDMICVNQLYAQLNQWNTDYTRCQNTPTMAKMHTIITEIYRRISHLVELDEERRTRDANQPSIPRREFTDYINYSVDSSGNRVSLLAMFYGEPDELPDTIPTFANQTPQIHQGLYLGDSQSLSEPPSAYTDTPYDYNGYRSVQATPSLTPSQTISSIRAMRSQSRQGNFAFIGRMMTESYSQSE